MSSKTPLIILIVVIILAILGAAVVVPKIFKSAPTPVITPTPVQVQQLSPDQAPVVSLEFSADAHYATVNITSVQAAALEYNLIYDAVVKNNQINTGVSASAKLDGQTSYSKRQLLGSESSGKFTYHANIQNAVLELTLRDSTGHSIYTATYPFTVSAGSTQTLSPQTQE